MAADLWTSPTSASTCSLAGRNAQQPSCGGRGGGVEALGSVDILVNSAGIALLADVAEFGRDLWTQWCRST